MATRPSVLLVDDGELGDVRELLEELGVELVHLRGGCVPAAVDPPTQVFITTCRRAVLARRWPPASGRPPRPTKVAIVQEDSNTARAMLRRLGFELLVRRPVHPYALRLVLLHALYRGDERRRESRVPVGSVVGFRVGLRRRSALLAEISPRGGRLLVKEPVVPGTRLTIQLPRSLGGGRGISLRAKVVRVSDTSPGGPYALAMAFENLSPKAQLGIANLLGERAEGPVRLPAPDLPAAFARPALPAAAPGSPEDRRKHERVSYRQQVVSLDQEADTVLMGRDLSLGGMRVDPNPQVKVGDLLRLAIYGGPREDALVVHAHVVRRETDGGFGLKFEQLGPAQSADLESLVCGLPSVESLERDEADRLGSVVSRILAQESPPETGPESGAGGAT